MKQFLEMVKRQELRRQVEGLPGIKGVCFCEPLCRSALKKCPCPGRVEIELIRKTINEPKMKFKRNLWEEIYFRMGLPVLGELDEAVMHLKRYFQECWSLPG